MSRPRDWSPLRGSDPVGGDPAAVERLATRYADTADAINRAAAALREIHGSSTVWESPAGQAFRDRTVQVADTIEKAFRRYDETAQALTTYARELDRVQYEADAALRRAQRAEGDREAARQAQTRNAQQPEPDPVADQRLAGDAQSAQATIDRADADLVRAEEDWHAAGNRAAEAIEDVAGGDGLKDSFWDNVLDVVDFVTEWAGTLSAILGVIAAICSIIPGLQPLAAVLGAAALVLGLISLAGNTLLYMNGRATLGDVLMDVVGVVTFGAGRAFQLAGRAMRMGARGLAKPAFIRSMRTQGMSHRQASRAARAQNVTGGGRVAKGNADRARTASGAWPTRSEWSTAYRPSSIHRDPVTGAAPAFPAGTAQLPEVAAALRRARYSDFGAAASDVTGAAVDTVQLPVPEGPSDSPVARNR